MTRDRPRRPRTTRPVPLAVYAGVRGPELLAAIRASVLARDGSACAYCGQPGDQWTLVLTFAVPRSRGGTGAWGNLQVACAGCHDEKGEQTAVEFASRRLCSSLQTLRRKLAGSSGGVI